MCRLARTLAFIGSLALAGCQPENSGSDVSGQPPPFDFYVLSLSWSPSYCLTAGDKADRQQCAANSGHGFVVHGLWPQFEKGYPEYCRSQSPDLVPPGLTRSMLDLMPSTRLIHHQWKKHGSCTGLGQRAYFDATRTARSKIVIPSAIAGIRRQRQLDPAAVEAAFIKSNPGLEGNAIAVTCGRRFLREIRICMTPDFSFRTCEEVNRNSCRLKSAVLPAPR